MQFLSHRDTDRLIEGVGRVEPHTIRSAAQPLDRVLAVDGHHDHASVDRLRRPVYHKQIAVQDAGILHRVAIDPHHEGCGPILNQVFRKIERSSGVSR